MKRDMAAGILAAGLALVLAVAIWFYSMTQDNEGNATPDTLPPDPAGRTAALRAALSAEGVTGRPAEIAVQQFHLETANGASAAFGLSLSPWNRHVGLGHNGDSYNDWNGRVCMKNNAGSWQVYDSEAAALKDDPKIAREHLRCYDSLRQAVRDFKGLLKLSIYAKAAAAFWDGDGATYARAIVTGNGDTGFVGPPNTTKGTNYTAALLSRFATVGVA